MSTTPIDLQSLIDAQTDADTLAAVINGPATGAASSVTSRLGVVLPTLAKALLGIAPLAPITGFSTGVINGTTTVFTLPGAPVILVISGNGIVYSTRTGGDYTVSGTTVTFAIAPKVSDNLYVQGLH